MLSAVIYIFIRFYHNVIMFTIVLCMLLLSGCLCVPEGTNVCLQTQKRIRK